MFKKYRKFKRIVLKLSGESLRNSEDQEIINTYILKNICISIKKLLEMDLEVCLVVGGGNIFRGLSLCNKNKIDRVTGDSMGMLATIINGLALMDYLKKLNIPVRILSSISTKEIIDSFTIRKALHHLSKKRLVISVAGTGNPYFSTDTAAALRANEINADIIMKGTKVDGIFEKDPIINKNAKKYEEISYLEAIKKRLKVMDLTAFSLCMENNIPILIFNINEINSIQKAIKGEKIGTLVHNLK